MQDLRVGRVRADKKDETLGGGTSTALEWIVGHSRGRGGVGAAAIIDALDAGVLATNSQGLITLANPCAARTLKRLSGQMIGRNVRELLAPIEELIAVSDNRAGDRNELRVSTADGSAVTIGLSVSVLAGRRPSDAHYLVLFRDLSPVLQLRKQRDSLMQMATLGNILPAVLHELRNPLAAVTAMLELMIEDTDGPLQADLHAMLWEVRRMHLSLQGVGGFSRSVASTSFSAVDTAIGEACRILRATAERKGVDVVCEVPDMPLLPLDPGVLSGVVFNLVTNAIDACKRGGKVVIHAGLVGNDTFQLVVRDDGRGMNSQTLERCRELFFTSKDGGTGIGLALCAEAASRAGGQLDIQSAPALGTTVTLSIPLKRKNQATTREVTNVTSR